MTRITQVPMGTSDTNYMDKKHIRSELTANQALQMAAKRTPAQQEAALVAARERAEIMRRLGV